MMRSYSQHGEDRRLWDFFQGQPTGVCVEVGGFDGVTFSNTLAFEENGWRAIIVEPIPAFAERIRARRPAATLFACAAGSAGGQIKLMIPKGQEALATTAHQASHLNRIAQTGAAMEEVVVPMRTMDELLSEAGANKIDFITIDVEGAELEVLRGLDLARWKPRVVILELNVRHSTVLERAMLGRGYHWLMNTGCNEWYIPATEKTLVTPSRIFSNSLRRCWRDLGMLSHNAREAIGLRRLERIIRNASRRARGKPIH